MEGSGPKAFINSHAREGGGGGGEILIRIFYTRLATITEHPIHENQIISTQKYFIYVFVDLLITIM